MLTQWFECKVRYDKTCEDGLIKSTNAHYLVDAFSFTEAEKRFIAEIEQFTSGDYTITDIKRAKIAEVVESNDSLADHWFKAKIATLSIDEKTGDEKRTGHMILVQAIDLRDTVKNIDKAMSNSMEDYVIVSVTETKILDVLRYMISQEPTAEAPEE